MMEPKCKFLQRKCLRFSPDKSGHVLIALADISVSAAPMPIIHRDIDGKRYTIERCPWAANSAISSNREVIWIFSRNINVELANNCTEQLRC
jgi:hypothetical protein